jgi:hydrogenase/urease accessory protein HupE
VVPDIVKPVPLGVPELIVRGAVPVDVNVTGSVVGVFTVTLPNVRLAALIVNCGLGTVAAVPVPLRLTTAVLLVEESLWMVS